MKKHHLLVVLFVAGIVLFGCVSCANKGAPVEIIQKRDRELTSNDSIPQKTDVEYYPNEKKKREVFYDDRRNKVQIKGWYQNGTLKINSYNISFDTVEVKSEIPEEIILKRRLLTIIEEEYFENGKRKSISGYSNGEKSGKWLYWNEEGTLIKKEIYENGENVKTVNF